mgnify:CR=1 FL=1
MRWESWSQFWDMGGYGVYVWGSMAVTALCLVVEVWLARQAQRQALALALALAWAGALWVARAGSAGLEAVGVGWGRFALLSAGVIAMTDFLSGGLCGIVAAARAGFSLRP